MFPAFQLNETEILCFALVLIRISAFIVAWPVFSVYSVPNHTKILFALVVAMVVFPVVDLSGLSGREISGEIAWLALREIFIGLCLGFMTRMFFFAISIGGNIASTAVGLGNGQIFNPALGSQASSFEQFYVVIATLFFLAIDGHHLFINGLVTSFEAVPLSVVGTGFTGFAHSGRFIQEVTVAGIQISAPVMISIFFVNVAMGIIGRAVPQINVLVTSLPVNIMVGLGIAVLMLPMFVTQMGDLLQLLTEQLFFVMKSL